MANISAAFKRFRESGKHLDGSRPLELQHNITAIEYVSLSISRFGQVLVSTLSSISSTFTYECYYGSVGIQSDELASISAIQTTITTILGYVVGLLVAAVAHKWKSKWGRYRPWYLIGAVPVFALTILNFVIPDFGHDGMISFRYVLAILSTIFTGFNNLGLNLPQVISPNFKEKKSVNNIWQIFYYLGYGGAYLYTFLFGLGSKSKQMMYFSLAVVAGAITLAGNMMCAVFCRERIELPKKEKVKLSGALFSLFKYKNYVAYHLFNWLGVLATVGILATYLCAITVGSDKMLLLTLPSAMGTVVGLVITMKLSKKYSPVQILKFTGVYSLFSALLAFFSVYITGDFGVLFFICYFLFGMSLGFYELSQSHMTVEFNDYLEWETGERLEATQGVVPGWINSALSYGKSILIPYALVWIGYKTSDSGNLVETMKVEPTYFKTCLWLLALLVFGFAASCMLRAVVLHTMYDIDGEKKKRMYEELSEMRVKRRNENIEIEKAEADAAEIANADV